MVIKEELEDTGLRGGKVFGIPGKRCSEDAKIYREVMVCIKNCPGLVRIKREFLESKHILLCSVECISPFASFLSFLAKIIPGVVSKSVKHLYLAF